MSLARRELLRLGGIGVVAAMTPRLPAAWSLARAGAARATDDRESPLDERWLRHGLDVLCGAHSTDAFFTGHAGGAIVSAYYLCREAPLEEGAASHIRKALDRHYPLANSPFPDEAPVEHGVADLLESMEEGLDQLVRSGHDVIFLSLAMRALHDLPEAATRSRLEALRRTLRSLQPRSGGASDLAIPETEREFAEFVLEEFLGSTEGGPGQGYSGHLLTHARAILDLRELGHAEFARKCLHAFKLAVAIARPRSPAKDWRAKRPAVEFVRPDRAEYWRRRAAAGTMELGHLFKYPYAFFGLRSQSKNAELNEVCTANSHRLFTS